MNAPSLARLPLALTLLLLSTACSDPTEAPELQPTTLAPAVERHLPCDPVGDLLREVGGDLRDCGHCAGGWVDERDCVPVAAACLDDAWQQCRPAHLTIDSYGADAVIRSDWVVVPRANLSGCDVVEFQDSRPDEYSEGGIYRTIHKTTKLNSLHIIGDDRGGSNILGTCKDGYSQCEVCRRIGWWPGGCSEAADCGTGQSCSFGRRCTCADDSACPDGQLCRHEVCVDCESDAGCVNGTSCLESGFCGCTEDAQCPSFHPRCLQGRCVECLDDQDCAPSEFCFEPNTCLVSHHESSDGGWVDVELGRDHACGLRVDGSVVCWGRDELDKLAVPAGTYTALAVALSFACALRQDDGTLRCWGQSAKTFQDVPRRPFTSVTAGRGAACALDATGAPSCWGSNVDTRVLRGPQASIAVNDDVIYGIDLEGHLRGTSFEESVAWSPLSETVRDVDLDEQLGCAVTTAGALACWGRRDGSPFLRAPLPSGTFEAVAVGDEFACALRTDGTLVCWGKNDRRQADPPQGVFTRVRAVESSACAVRADGVIVCWGAGEALLAPP